MVRRSKTSVTLPGADASFPKTTSSAWAFAAARTATARTMERVTVGTWDLLGSASPLSYCGQSCGQLKKSSGGSHA
jgi:hypothetical protein